MLNWYWVCICVFGLWVGTASNSPEALKTIDFSPSQTELYYVFFIDKVHQPFDTSYFHPLALERKSRQGLPLWTERDMEVNGQYVSEVAQLADSLRYTLRWLNAVTLKADLHQIAAISTLPFVHKIRPFQSQAILSQSSVSKANVDNPRLDTLLSLGKNLLHLPHLDSTGLNGKGVRIAVLDAGFKGMDKHPAFRHLFKSGQIAKTFDFYEQEENVFRSSDHGMQVMSSLAGKYQDRNMGAATGAEFLLARVVQAHLALNNEEDHWIAAAEWAERNGANILSTSVSYIENYRTPGEMDGRSSPVSLAAIHAIENGMLVVSAMGNHGDQRWKIMGAPADAVEVLSVGGTYPMIPQRLPTASTGPNARRKIKPDVASPAFVLSALKGKKYGEASGTSFSAPMIAGIAACMLEQAPELLPEEIHQRVRESGHFFPYYDYDLGYGVPDMRRLFDSTSHLQDSIFQIELRGDTVWIQFDTLFMQQDTLQFPYGHMLYYHLERPEEYLSAYQTFRLPNSTRSHYFLRKRPTFGKMRVWMDGYLLERRFNGE